MLRLLLQALSYGIAGAIPYLMVTRSVQAPFYFSLLAVPLLVLLYLSGPYKAAGICIYATLVGTNGFIFTMGDLQHLTPLVLALETAWLWGLFWVGSRMIESKELGIHRLQEEIEKLELQAADSEQQQKELETSSDGLRERISRYIQLRSFTDALASGLELQQIREQIEASIGQFFRQDGQVRARLDLFPSPNSPRKDDAIGEWIVDYRMPLLIPDLSLDPRYYIGQDGRQGSLIACSVERENLVAGTLALESSDPKTWKEEDLRLLCDISNIVSLAISNAVYYQKIASLAVRDQLTGLFVRYRFDERIQEEFARARASRTPLSLLMLDIDHFKQVNDKWGHLAGDRVLHDAAQIVLGLTRETDFCARYGGEELAVLMPLTAEDNALAIADRIRKKIEGQPIGPDHVRVTVSGGIASAADGLSGPDDLVAAADKALYAAKNRGRNRIVTAP